MNESVTFLYQILLLVVIVAVVILSSFYRFKEIKRFDKEIKDLYLRQEKDEMFNKLYQEWLAVHPGSNQPNFVKWFTDALLNDVKNMEGSKSVNEILKEKYVSTEELETLLNVTLVSKQPPPRPTLNNKGFT